VDGVEDGTNPAATIEFTSRLPKSVASAESARIAITGRVALVG
jgi:hypothetical protein